MFKKIAKAVVGHFFFFLSVVNNVWFMYLGLLFSNFIFIFESVNDLCFKIQRYKKQ